MAEFTWTTTAGPTITRRTCRLNNYLYLKIPLDNSHFSTCPFPTISFLLVISFHGA